MGNDVALQGKLRQTEGGSGVPVRLQPREVAPLSRIRAFGASLAPTHAMQARSRGLLVLVSVILGGAGVQACATGGPTPSNSETEDGGASTSGGSLDGAS